MLVIVVKRKGGYTYVSAEEHPGRKKDLNCDPFPFEFQTVI